MNSQVALAHRAVGCGHWQWKPGMIDSRGFRLIRPESDNPESGWVAVHEHKAVIVRNFEPEFPNFEDPGTLGCLLQLVREAWDNKTINTIPNVSEGWFVGFDCGRCIDGATEAEALVIALELVV